MTVGPLTGFDFTSRYKRERKGAPDDVRKAADQAVSDLLKNPRSHRCHALKGFKPTVFAVDVFSNHSWQLTFEIDDGKMILRRLAKHNSIDRTP